VSKVWATTFQLKTISTYRARILEKMGMKNNVALMQYTIEHQLVG
jgi:two-component system invasion response regulator UvrY